VYRFRRFRRARLVAASLPVIVLATAAPTVPAAAAKPDRGPTGAWKDQVIMTVEVSKYASAGPDAGQTGDNSANSNDIQRFQYALDDPQNQPPVYQGSGMFGGDLVGFRNKVDHLKRLGVTTTLIYPVMETDRQEFFSFLPTGYNIRDFRRLDANFNAPGAPGDDLTAYRDLVADLRDPAVGGYKINVLQDMSLAITGREHPWFGPEGAAANIDRYRRWDPTNMANNSGAWDGSGAMSPQDSVFVDISDTFNTDAFSYVDGQTDGDMDTLGRTYPAERLGYSAYAGIGFDNNLGYRFGLKLNGRTNATAGHATQDRVFTLPADQRFKYATLSLAVAAVGGDKSATFRVRYADGTTQDTTVTVPDWAPAGTPANVLVRLPYRYTPFGTDTAQPTYIYHTELAIDPTKTVTDVRLAHGPDAPSVRVFALSGVPVVAPLRVDLTDYYNEDGIASAGAPGDGDLNGAGILFPVGGLFRRLTTSIVGVFPATTPATPTTARFAVGPMADGRDNMVRAVGQTVDVADQRYHRFRLAAFATGGTTRQVPFRVNYTDGSSTTTIAAVKPLTAASAAGDVLVHQSEFAWRNTGSGWLPDSSVQPKIWGYQLAADWQKTVASVTLPDDPHVHVVGLNPEILIDSGFALPILDHRSGMESGTGMYDEFVSIIRHWMDNGQLDGLRIDSVQKYYPEVFDKFIDGEWKHRYPGRWLFGEAAVSEPRQCADPPEPGCDPDQKPLPWQKRRWEYTNPSAGIGFTGVYDFETADAIRDTFGRKVSAVSDGGWSLMEQSLRWDNRYEQPWNQVAFFDVYENFPFLRHATGESYEEKLPKLRLAAAYLFAINRVPMLFSGNEYLLEYGGEAPNGSAARKPGYLFTPEVTGNATYQDNYAYMRQLIQTRKGSSALRSAEKMTSAKWFLKGDSLFGFVRQGASGEKVIAVFNNSPNPVSTFDARLPAGVTGHDAYNFILKNPDGTYGGHDQTVSWPSPRTVRISAMQPWEAKLIRIS
jgi:glycosidase